VNAAKEIHKVLPLPNYLPNYPFRKWC